MANGLSREEWYGLSHDIKLRWYVETQFDKFPPSPELLAEAKAYLSDGAGRPGATDALPPLITGSREPAGD